MREGTTKPNTRGAPVRSLRPIKARPSSLDKPHIALPPKPHVGQFRAVEIDQGAGCADEVGATACTAVAARFDQRGDPQDDRDGRAGRVAGGRRSAATARSARANGVDTRAHAGSPVADVGVMRPGAIAETAAHADYLVHDGEPAWLTDADRPVRREVMVGSDGNGADSERAL